MGKSRTMAVGVLAVAAGLSAAEARADEASAADVDVVQQLQTEAPTQVATFLRAERLAAAEPLTSLGLYEEVGRKTTAFSEAHRRACLLALVASTRDHALRLCEGAIGRLRGPANVAALALVYATPVDGRPLDSARARELAAEALADPDADALTAGAVCSVEAALDPPAGDTCARGLPDGEIAARTEAFAGVLQAAMKAEHTVLAARVAQDLTALAPDEEFGWTQMATLAAHRRDVPTLRHAAAQLRRLTKRGWAAPYFESLAFEIEGNVDAAARTLAEAERAGLSPSELARTRARRAERARLDRLRNGPKWALGVAATSWLVLVAATVGLSKRWSRKLEEELAGGAPLPRADDLTPRKERTRFAYGLTLRGFAIVSSELWWSFVSWVALLLLWQPWRSGKTREDFSSDAWMMTLVIGGLIGTIWRYARPKPLPDPGLRLSLPEHPVLAQILDEVAEAVSAPRIGEVYLTRGRDLSVVARGTLVSNLRGTGRPCLIVGAELLQEIDIQAFRALLAQAHQHIAQDEIPGATFALAARARLRRERRTRGAQSSWDPFRPARDWIFRAFDEISRAAVRFQELRGDRLAVAAYGYDAFERGLSAITRDRLPEKAATKPTSPVDDPYRDEPPLGARPTGELADRLARVQAVRRLEGSEDFDEDTRRRAWLLLSKRRELKAQLGAHLQTTFCFFKSSS